MNNDARFFFYLSGFVGFVLFFLLGTLISRDFVTALVQSAFGCLFFGICGRFLLSFILNGIILDSGNQKPQPSLSPTLPSTKERDAAKLSVADVNESALRSNHMVETKA
mgnify:FL=1